jgi:uncharacterized RDD family membrane protein YckC
MGLGLSTSIHRPKRFNLMVSDGGSFVMQCPSCRAVYSNGLDVCPRCKTPSLKSSAETVNETVIDAPDSPETPANVLTSEEAEVSHSQVAAAAPQPSSTLIEFPGVSRATRPQWRKDLSERVREIQERKARDAEAETEEFSQRPVKQPTPEQPAPQLGLVPQQDAPPVNPIVAAALKRLERARQSPTMPRPRASMGGAAAAAIARVAEEQYQTEIRPTPIQASAPSPAPAQSQPQTETVIETKAAEPAREHSLIIVPPQTAVKAAVPVTNEQAKRVIAESVEVTLHEGLDEELAGPDFDAELYDDRAPVLSRIAGSAIDFLVVAFASSPFAAIIELTNGNWGDLRVIASMGGIVLVVMFLYLTAATALAGRTWGMSLVSLRAVDADTGLPPTTKQSVVRALLYIVSLLALGLGILYALFDAEGRTAHDRFSATAVVRE